MLKITEVVSFAYQLRPDMRPSRSVGDTRQRSGHQFWGCEILNSLVTPAQSMGAACSELKASGIGVT